MLKEFGVDYVQGFLLGKPEIELLDEQYISLKSFKSEPVDMKKFTPKKSYLWHDDELNYGASHTNLLMNETVNG